MQEFLSPVSGEPLSSLGLEVEQKVLPYCIP